MTGCRGPAFDLSGFLPYRLNVLAGRVSRSLAAVYGRRFGLTIPEWRILAHLSQVSGVSVGEVQARVDMDKVKVTRAVARLQEAGLVSKQTNQQDRRLVRLSLTAAGRERMDALIPYVKQYEEGLLSVLDATEQDVFLRALAKLEAATAAATAKAENAKPNQERGHAPDVHCV